MFKKVIGSFTAVTAGFVLFSAISADISLPTPVAPATAQPAAAQPAAAPNWLLTQYKDEMTGKMVNSAVARSSNIIYLGWPYQGPQRGTLTLRKHPRWGTDVIFAIERGQLLCRYQGCSVMVRFDDGPAKKVTAFEPDDHDSTMLFLQTQGNFIAQLRKSKRVAIEVSLFQQGNQTLVFENSEFPNELFPAPTAKKK